MASFTQFRTMGKSSGQVAVRQAVVRQAAATISCRMRIQIIKRN